MGTTKDLGIVSAYGYAVSKGYEGTEEEFAESMATFSESAEMAISAAERAENAASRFVTDKYLINENVAADARAVGNRLASKVQLPSSNDYGNSGQLLRSTGSGTEWATYGTPSDEQTATAVQNWLDEHPEATTTVADGSITSAKMSAEAKNMFFNLTARIENRLSAGTDYNTILTPGDYFCHTNASASSMINCPIAYPHKLLVFESTTNRFTQLIIGNSSNLSIYKRFSNGTTWTDWARAVGTSDSVLIDRTISDQDLNNLTTMGLYPITSDAIDTKENLPERTPGRLLVFNNSSNSLVQVYFTSTGITYYRYKTSSAWLGWNKIATEPNYLLNTNLTNVQVLSRETDYNNLRTPGTYVATSASIASSMLNCPAPVVHVLIVARINVVADRLIQIVICQNSTCDIYVRTITGSVVNDWQKINGLYPENNLFVRRFAAELKKPTTECYAIEDTLPIMTHEAGVSRYYDKGTLIPGMLYSSVWRDGTDVFRNLTLETFYSAMANPTSVMYTKDYSDRNISNAHSWYGSVCSTFVCSLIGKRFYTTTADLINSMEDKDINSVYDIEIGDPIVMPGHMNIVTQIYTDSKGNIVSFEISEMTSLDYSVYRQKTYSVEKMKDYIATHDWHVKVNPNPNKFELLGDVTYNPEIIFEKGNNTYITGNELSNGAWFYIPNVDQFYCKKGNGEYLTYYTIDFPTKTIKGYTVYNLAECFDGVGDYYFTHDVEAEKTCLIKVINVGNVVLSGNTLSISGWQNCTPYNYYIVKETVRTSESSHYGFDPSEGYIASQVNGKNGEINIPDGATSVTVTIPEDYLTGLTRYKVWLEYKTGLGYKQVFSNLVVL